MPKTLDESTPKDSGRGNERTPNLWRRERLVRGESIDFDAGLGRTGEIDVISDCECTVCRVDQPKLLRMDDSEGEYRGGAVCFDCLRAVLSGPEACDHKWVDARNEVVTSGEICSKCSSIRAQETPRKPDDTDGPEFVVHVLRYGATLCGFMPRWPQGHSWLRLEEAIYATCPACIAAAKVTQSGQTDT